jgi:hypothetical protein
VLETVGAVDLLALHGPDPNQSEWFKGMEIIIFSAAFFAMGYGTRAWISHRRRRLAQQLSPYYG